MDIDILQVFNDLFINLTIVATAVFFSQLFLRNRRVRTGVRDIVLYGILAGALAGVLMNFPISVNESIFFDFRYLPILLMGIYVSYIAGYMAALVLFLVQFMQFGLSIEALIALSTAFVVAATTGFVGRRSMPIGKKWVWSVIVINFASLAQIVVESNNLAMLIMESLLYVSSTVVVSILAYYLIESSSFSTRRFIELREESERDFLTGLYNSRFFNRLLLYHVQVARKHNQHLSVLFVDIDHFKKINDQYGHGAGDAVLKELAVILQKQARSADIVSRKGGEEFVVLMVDCDLKQAERAAERIRKAVESHAFIVEERMIKMTISIGVASYPSSTQREELLIELADKALYRAKEDGRNCVRLADGEEILPTLFNGRNETNDAANEGVLGDA